MNSFVPSVKVTLYITADKFDLDEITRWLDIIPTKTRTKDSFPLTGLACTLWSYEIKEEYCLTVSSLFEKFLTVFRKKERDICQICDYFKLDAKIEIVIHMKDGESPEVVLTKEAISFAAAIHAEVGFDIYCYE